MINEIALFLFTYSIAPVFMVFFFIFADKYENHPEWGKFVLVLLALIPLITYGGLYYLLRCSY